MVFFTGKLALHINISLGCKGLSYTNALVYLLASVMKKTVLLFCLMVSNGVIHKISYGVFHWQAGLTHKYQTTLERFFRDQRSNLFANFRVSRFTMLDTPVPIRSLKLSNIGPGYYLDGRPLQGISGSAGTFPPC